MSNMDRKDETLYVVYLHGVPISVFRDFGMACNEARERSTRLGEATVHVYQHDFETALDEEKTNPDCVPCGHGFGCDDEWKTSGAV